MSVTSVPAFCFLLHLAPKADSKQPSISDLLAKNAEKKAKSTNSTAAKPKGKTKLGSKKSKLMTFESQSEDDSDVIGVKSYKLFRVNIPCLNAFSSLRLYSAKALFDHQKASECVSGYSVIMNFHCLK